MTFFSSLSRIFLILLSIAFSFSIAMSQTTIERVEDDALAQPYNLGFEFGTEGRLPIGWWLMKNAQELGFSAETYTGQSVEGRHSMIIQNLKTENLSLEGRMDASAVVYQTIDAYLYRGRKIRVSAAGKAKDINSGNGFRVWIRAKFREENPGEEAYNDDYIKSTEWATDVVEFRIPRDADIIEFGVETRGEGPYYIDAFQVEYADRKTVTKTAARELTSQEKAAIYDLGSLQYTIKAFNPFFEGAGINWNSLLYNGINEIVNKGKSFKEVVNEIYVPYTSGLKVADKPIKAAPIKREKAYDEFVAYAWTHKGIYNMNMSDPLSSAVVNIYQPVPDQQYIVYKTVKLDEGIKGLPVDMSAMVKTDPIGPGAHAQLWLRYEGDNGQILRTRTMYDDMIRATDWTKVRLLDTVPSIAKKMTFALVVTGNGNFWFDDVKVGFKQGPMITYITMQNDDFEDDPSYPMTWNVAEGAQNVRYRMGIDKEVSYNGNALKVWTPRNEFDQLVQEGETISLSYGTEENPVYINMPLSTYIQMMKTKPEVAKGPEDSFKNYPPLAYDSEDMISRLTLVADIAGMKENFSLENLNKNEIYTLMDEAAQGNSDMAGLMNNAVRAMDDPAARYWNIYEYDRFTIPAYLEAMQGEYVLVSNSYDTEKFSVGDRIISINGKNIWDEINDYVDRSHDANKLLALRKALLDIVSFPLPENIELGVIDSSGKQRTVSLLADFPANKVSQPSPGMSKILDDSTAYVDLRPFSDEDFKAMVENLADYKTLIFDMRGASAINEYMLGYFIDEPIDNIEYRLRIYTKPGRPSDTLVFKDKIRPLKGLENKEVYFLIDERTSGSLEQIAFLVRDNRIGKLVGFPTSGTLAQTNSTTLPGDYNLMLAAFDAYNPEGQPLKGIAVKPDILSGSELRAVYMGYDNVIVMAYQDSKQKNSSDVNK